MGSRHQTLHASRRREAWKATRRRPTKKLAVVDAAERKADVSKDLGCIELAFFHADHGRDPSELRGFDHALIVWGSKHDNAARDRLLSQPLKRLDAKRRLARIENESAAARLRASDHSPHELEVRTSELDVEAA